MCQNNFQIDQRFNCTILRHTGKNKVNSSVDRLVQICETIFGLLKAKEEFFFTFEGFNKDEKE